MTPPTINSIRYFDENAPLHSQLTAKRLNQLVKAIQGCTPRPGVGTTLQRFPGGFAYSAAPQNPIIPATLIAWPFKVYNTSTATTPQVQINGGDGFVGQLNGFVANVNGNPINVQMGTPSAYPQLSITANGFVYFKATCGTPGDPTTINALDILFATTLPAQDTATPAAFFIQSLATITAFTSPATFTLSNVTNYGFTTLYYCGTGLQVY